MDIRSVLAAAIKSVWPEQPIGLQAKNDELRGDENRNPFLGQVGLPGIFIFDQSRVRQFVDIACVLDGILQDFEPLVDGALLNEFGEQPL